jgi:hypothetical protein
MRKGFWRREVSEPVSKVSDKQRKLEGYSVYLSYAIARTIISIISSSAASWPAASWSTARAISLEVDDQRDFKVERKAETRRTRLTYLSLRDNVV